MNESNPPSVSGNRNDSFQDETLFKKKSNLQRLTIGLVVLFIVTTVIFVVLFAYFYTRQDKATTSSTSATICNTENCVIAAATMAKKMNLSVDPCVDFNEYACGRFIAETMIPEGSSFVTSFTIVEDENILILKDIIVQDIKQGEPTYLSNMKRFYKSCINEAKIEEIGLDQFLNDKPFIDDWPTLNQNWNEDSFNLNDVIERYEKVYVQPLFMYDIQPDPKNSSKNAIFLDDSEVAFRQRHSLRPRNDSYIMAYEKYLAETAVVLKANRTVAEKDAKDVTDLKIALSKIMVPSEERGKQYNPVPLSNLTELYPNIDIPRALRAAFATANITLLDNETVINVSPTYIGNLSNVLQNFPKRTVQNLFGFDHAIFKVKRVTRKLREIWLELYKANGGTDGEEPRRKTCLIIASDTFVLGMAKQYVTRKFTESSKIYIKKMTDNLQKEFIKMINESTWMEQATKDEAYKKLVSMKRRIGYPDEHFQKEDIETIYENYTMLEENYYANNMLKKNMFQLNKLLELGKPVDKNEWPVNMAPLRVNAGYDTARNALTFPAGIVQPPFFSQTFQDCMNYGGIGATIGHEITHGFDNGGSKYDADGNLRNWWQKTDRVIFVEKIQCIIDQNSNFYIPDLNMTLDGYMLQGESVSDNVGLKQSFRAYKELVRKNGEQPTLPGLNLTQDQLFFLAYAQIWCQKMTRDKWIYIVTVDPHPPGKYRILGPLQNSEEFAKAYNCPRGSYMNPEKKCSVW